jgi:hypothetical protein
MQDDAQTVRGILLVATAGIVVIGAVSALGGQAPTGAKPPAFEVWRRSNQIGLGT